MQQDPQESLQKKRNTTLLVILAVVLLGGCGCVAVLAAILFPVFAQAKLAARKTQTLGQMKEVAVAIAIYSADNDDRYPLAENWQDVAGQNLTLSQADAFEMEWLQGQGVGIAHNSHLSGWNTNAVEQLNQTPMLFLGSGTERNLSGGEELFLDPTNSPLQSSIVAFADTSASVMDEDEHGSLVWLPHPDWPNEPVITADAP